MGYGLKLSSLNLREAFTPGSIPLHTPRVFIEPVAMASAGIVLDIQTRSHPRPK